MSNIDKRALREAAEKATALNLDTAQVKRGNDGYLECPCCEGAGYVDEEADFCNIDGVALGVQFYGIGEYHGLAEEFFRAANPATVLALLDELEAKDKRIEDSENRIRQQNRNVCEMFDENTALRKRVAELEGREPDLYLCRVNLGGAELYSPCGKDYPRGRGYIAAGTAKGE